MKKYLSLCLTFLLLWQMLVIPPTIHAEEQTAPVVFSFSASQDNAAATEPISCVTGETLTLYLHVTADTPYSIFGLRFRESDGTWYYPDIFSNLQFLDTDYLTKTVEIADSRFTDFDHSLYTQPISVKLLDTYAATGYKGYICELQFQVASYAKPGIYTIGDGMFSYVQNGETEVESAVQPVQIKVTHPLTTFEATESTCAIPGNLLYYACHTCKKYFIDDLCTTSTTPAAMKLPTPEHTYTSQYDDMSHWTACKVCGTIFGEKTPHTDTYQYNNDGRWKKCADCKWHSKTEPHKFVVVSDAQNHWQECSKCKYIIGSEEHLLISEFDADNHWNRCSTCDKILDKTTHNLIDDGNTIGSWQKCDGCSYTTQMAEHTLVMMSNKEKHWQECTKCHATFNENEHIPVSKSNATHHWEECSVCGYKILEEAHATENNAWEKDNTYHYHICTTCKTPFDKTSHSGTPATCKDYAKCTICGKSYGSLSAEHSKKTIVVDAYPATCNKEGSTGITFCTLCTMPIKSAEPIPSTKNHAVVDHTWKDDGNGNHYQECGGCGKDMNKAAHSGGTATCKSQAICSTCKLPYGEKDKTMHIGPFRVEGAKPATHDEKGSTGETICDSCNTTISESQDIPKTDSHTDANGKWESNDEKHWYLCSCEKKFEEAKHKGGTATCSTKAICEDCGIEYGDYDYTNHIGGTYLEGARAATCNESGYTGDRYCSSCKTDTNKHLVREGTTISPTGKHVDEDGEWNSDKTGHFNICGCGTHYNYQAHTFVYDKTNPKGHHKKCTVCGYKEPGLDEHTFPTENITYSWDTKDHYPICEVCNAKGHKENHEIDKTTGKCICGYEDLTAIEVKIKTKDLMDQNTQKTISDTATITAILDLVQHVEANADALSDLDKPTTPETTEKTTAEKVTEMLEKVDLISVDITSGNATVNNAEADTKNDNTVTIDEEAAKSLIKSVGAAQAEELSQAIREAEAKPTENLVPPRLVMSFHVAPAQETAHGVDIAREAVMDIKDEKTGAALVLESQLDMYVQANLVVGTEVKSSTTLTELKEYFTFKVDLPKDEVDAGKVFVFLHTHTDENGTVTTEILEDHDDDSYTYTIKTKKFSIITLSSVTPELGVTGTAYDKTMDVEVKVKNPKNGVLLTAVYSSGVMVAVKSKNLVALDIKDSEVNVEDITYDSETNTMTYKTTFDYAAGYTVRTFLLENGSFAPICDSAEDNSIS